MGGFMFNTIEMKLRIGPSQNRNVHKDAINYVKLLLKMLQYGTRKLFEYAIRSGHKMNSLQLEPLNHKEDFL